MCYFTQKLELFSDILWVIVDPPLMMGIYWNQIVKQSSCAHSVKLSVNVKLNWLEISFALLSCKGRSKSFSQQNTNVGQKKEWHK